MRATFPLDPEPDGLAYAPDPDTLAKAEAARPWLEYQRNDNNARDWGTPRPQKPEGHP